MDQIPCITPSITRSGNADYWFAARYNGVLYFLGSNSLWTTVPTPMAQGGLANVSSLMVLDLAFPAGSTVEYFYGVDLTMSGVFDTPYRIETATFGY